MTVGVRANVRLALRQDGFNVVRRFEPGVPSLWYVALRDAEALALGDVVLAESCTPLDVRSTEAACSASTRPRDVRGAGRCRRERLRGEPLISPGSTASSSSPREKNGSWSSSSCESRALPVARAALRALPRVGGLRTRCCCARSISDKAGG